MAVGVLENVRNSTPPSFFEVNLDAQNVAIEKTRKVQKGAELDAEKMRDEHRRLLDWYYQEREKQAVNRYQMAIDHDFYDNLQWSDEDAQEVANRGQIPIVYNDVAPMCDWMIGTERRSKVDWNVLPRTEDDVDAADAKKKTLKYVSDVNQIPFKRSRAFSDSIKVGVGWLEDGARANPGSDVLFSRYEDWRYIIWDSSGNELDLSDSRYLFRWRWVDLDIAKAMFPDRVIQLERAAVGAQAMDEEEEEFWYMGQHFQARNQAGQVIGRRSYVSDAGMVGNRRSRVRLVEGWYRLPARCKVCYGDMYDGQEYDPKHPGMAAAVSQGATSLYDQVQMRMHVALFTEGDMLSWSRSPYRHDQFPFTPIWCYRRGRDRMPYGVIRRVRDIQEDINKRASKALFILSSNQIISEEGATEDWEAMREEADRPDGVMVVRKGYRFEINRDTEMGKGQLEMMAMNSAKIQRTAGINDENLGRQTNAESGEAIKARQLQGSVSTTEPFDNRRLAIQLQGQKQVSLIEQYYSEPKVIRLTGAQPGQLDWVKVNQPEIQPDGSVRWLNDITATQADFVVSEQDYSGSMRQVMFETMSGIVSRHGIEPQLALKLMRMAYQYSDFPNKDEIVTELRKMTGETDPTKKLTPEEQAAAEQARQAQVAAMQLAQKQAILTVEKIAAEVKKLNNEADKIRAEAGAVGQDGGAQISAAVGQVQERAAREIERLTQDLTSERAKTMNQTAQIKADADTKVEVARIQAESVKSVADINNKSTKIVDALMNQMRDIRETFETKLQKMTDDAKARERERDIRDREEDAKRETKAAAKETKAAKEKPAAVPATPPSVNLTIAEGALQIGNEAAKPVAKRFKFKTSKGTVVEGEIAPVNEPKSPDKKK